MGARRRMTHRASTIRSTAGPQTDPFGNPITSEQPVLTSHPCYWQPQVERFIADGEKVITWTSELILFPVGTDIREADRVTAVTDRRGRSLSDTRLRIVAAVPREDHIEARAEEYT